MSITLLQADARALPLADASVDLVVTSPPYFGLRSYTDGGEHYDGQIGAEPTPAAYVDSLIEVTRECMRVLKPTGSIWVNLGDKYSDRGHGPSRGRGTSRGPQAETLRQTRGPMEKSLLGLPWRYAIRCVDELQLIQRAEVIWSKPNGLPESVTDRVRRSHETWFHFTTQQRYFANIDAIREPHTDTSTHAMSRRSRTDSRLTAAHAGMVSAANPSGKLPSSEGGTVLDPFGRTGTTALVADVLGRHGISADMSADYLRIATWRTNDPKQRARALNGRRQAVAA